MSERQPVRAHALGRSASVLLVSLAVAAVPWWGPVPLILAGAWVIREAGCPGLVSAPVLGGALLLAISHLAASDAWSSWQALARWALLAFAVAAGAGLARLGRGRLLTAGLALFGCAGAVMAWWQLLVSHPRLLAAVEGGSPGLVAQLADGRANGPFLLPGHFGALQAALVVLLLGAALGARGAGRRREELFAWAGLAVVFAGFLASRSLASAALLGLALVVLGAVALRGRPRRWLIAGFASLAIVLFVAFTWSRADALRRENPAEARWLNWTAAARLVSERPVAGWGGGGFAREYGRVRPAGANEARHAHQAWLEAAAEHGSAFALLLLWPVAALARAGWRLAREAVGPESRWERAGPVAAGVVVLGHGLADFGWSRPEWLAWAGLLLGASLVLPSTAAAPRPPLRERWAALVLGTLVVLVASGSATERRALERARQLGAEGRHDDAAAAAAAAAARVTGSSELAAVEARALLAAGRRGEAVAASEAAVRRSPRRSVLHAIRAQALAAEGRRLEAWLAAERAAALAPTVAERVALRDALRPAGRAP